MKTLFICLFFLMFVSSCDLFESSNICSSDFRYVNILVLTQENEPAVLDEIRVLDKHTGSEIDLCQPDTCPEGSIMGIPEVGSYVIIHDHFVGKIRKRADLQVEGKGQQGNFQETFRVTDNGCNISKTAGPDTVFVTFD